MRVLGLFALPVLVAVASIVGACDNNLHLIKTTPDDPPVTPPLVTKCFDASLPPSTIAPVVELVLDRSGSMREPEPGGPTRWDVVVSAVNDMVSRHDGEIAFGLTMFPSPESGADQCAAGAEVVGAHTGNAAAIANALLPQWSTPHGGTPTAATLLDALNILANVPRGTPTAVVLATDGAPNCNPGLDVSTCLCGDPTQCGQGSSEAVCLDRDATVAAATDLLASGIPTYVIGLGDTSGFGFVLDAVADAGGTGRGGSVHYYPAADGGALGASLDDVRIRVERCQRAVDKDLTAATEVDVNVNGTTITRDPSHTNGFDVSNDGRVTLFGTACDNAVADDSPVDVHVCEQVPDTSAL